MKFLRHKTMRALAAPCLLAAALACAPGKASAVPMIATNGGTDLLFFDSASPGTITRTVAMSGFLSEGESFVGIDDRPADGRLYGVTNASRLYRINKNTGVVTQIGSDGGFTVQDVQGFPVSGLDFNPVPDRLRLISTIGGQNLRINPSDGTAITDTAINPTSYIAGAAYTNPDTDAATGTSLFAINALDGTLLSIANPNSGTTTVIGSLGLGGSFGLGAGFDIAPGGTLFAAIRTTVEDESESIVQKRLFTINPSTGAATSLGLIGNSETELFTLAVDLTETPTSLVVTNLNDNPNTDEACTAVGTGDGCNLREAIDAVNNDDNEAGSRVTFAVSGTINLTQELPILTSDTTIINTQNTGVTVNGNTSNPSRIFEISENANVTLQRLTISGGRLVNDGGAGIKNSGNLTLRDCTLSGNQTVFDGTQLPPIFTIRVKPRNDIPFILSPKGGALNNFGGATATIINCTISNNTADVGGGIYNEGQMLVLNSTISNNTASSTMSGGGGLVNFDGSANPPISTDRVTPRAVTDNFQIGNTIVANNTASVGPDASGTFGSQGNNLIGNMAGAVGFGATDLQNVDPLLGALTNNGGPTQTRALPPTSPAVDAGNDDLIPEGVTTDQRGAGFNRISRDTVDIGAYELRDNVAPTIAITAPTSGAILNAFPDSDGTPVISGTTQDNFRVVRVDLYLQRQNDKKFWNGTSWTPFSLPESTLSTKLGRVTAGTAVPWSSETDLPTGADLASGPYLIVARAFDSDGNATSTSLGINIDTIKPLVAISSPANNPAISVQPEISGSALDTEGGSGVNRVTLVLRRNGFGDYWNGTNWAGSTPVAFNATLTGTNWKRDGGLPVVATADATKKLTDGGYTVTAVAYDRAGNLSPFISANFTVDTKKPVVAISTPANNANVSTLPSVSGTASDVANGSGVATVALYLQRKSDNKYWNGTSWVAPISALTTTISGTTWTRTSGLPSGADLSIGNYFLAARATDRAGNGESATSNFRVVAGSSVAQASPSTVALSSASAKTDGTIRLSFTGALGASAADVANYSVSNNDAAVALKSASQPDASTVEIKAGALSSGARIAVSYDVQDAQGRVLKGTATVVVR